MSAEIARSAEVKKKNAISYIHVAIMLALMLGVGYLPAAALKDSRGKLLLRCNRCA